MSRRWAVAPTLLAVAALVAPATVGAATLEVQSAKPCYGTSDQVSLAGRGFTPRGSVNVLRDGKLLNRTQGRIEPIATDAQGRVAVVATAPDLERAVKTARYSVVDRANPSIRASAPVRLSDLRVTIEPDDAAADRPRRIKARGFTAGRTVLYGHVVRGTKRRTFRVGRLSGACKTTSATRRLFGKQATSGTYRVQFDTSEKYRPSTEQRIRFNVAIKRVTGSAAAGVAAVALARRAF